MCLLLLCCRYGSVILNTPPPSLKKILFWGQMGNFGLIVTQNYTSVYLRICSKDFFEICSIIGHSKQMKFTQVKFPKKSTFGSESFDHLESTVPFVLILFLMLTTLDEVLEIFRNKLSNILLDTL